MSESTSNHRKSKRKIICLGELNKFDRKSLVITPQTRSQSERKVTKKNKSPLNLPKINFDLENKENDLLSYSKNSSSKKIKKSKRKQSDSEKNTENITNRTYPDLLSRDNDVINFADIDMTSTNKLKKSNKKLSNSEITCAKTNADEVLTDDLHPDSFQLLENKNEVTSSDKLKCNKNQRNSEKKNRVASVETQTDEEIQFTRRKKKNIKNRQFKSDKKINTNLPDKTTSCFRANTEEDASTTKCFTENEKSLSKSTSRSLSVENLALTPTDEELIDDVFSDSFKLSETLECGQELASSKKRNTFELKNSTFEISDLPVVKDGFLTKRKSVRFSPNEIKRRSKSWEEKRESSKKSVSFMSKAINKSRTERVSNISLGSRKSVRFSSSHTGEKSLIFPKSPHVKKLSALNMNSPAVKLRKSKSLCDEKDGTPNFSITCSAKNSFVDPKSPHIKKLSTLSASSPSLDVKKTTFFCDEKYQTPDFSATSSAKKSFVYPKSPHTKKLSTLSVNSLSEVKKLKYSEENVSNPLENRITKRKRWNKSMEVSVLNSSGFLCSISPPWMNVSSDFDFGAMKTNPTSLSSTRKSSSAEVVDEPLSFNNSKRNAKQSILASSVGKSSFDESISPIKQMKIKNSGTKSNCLKFSDSNFEELAKATSPRKIIMDQKRTSFHLQALDSTFSPSIKVKKSVRIDSPSLKNVETKSTIKKTKLPNFALIHQRAYDKLENLKEMSERKVARAQLLLSGKKPGEDTKMKSQSSNLKVGSSNLKIKSPKSKKLLSYSPKRKSLGKFKKSKSPAVNLVTNIKEKITPSTSNPKVITRNPTNTKISKIPKLKVEPEKQKKGLTKLGFKAGLKGERIVSKELQIKAIANKTNVKRNSIEARRNNIKNVRSNRRFDLLMKMRNEKK